jgi:hypothetical protein
LTSGFVIRRSASLGLIRHHSRRPSRRNRGAGLSLSDLPYPIKRLVDRSGGAHCCLACRSPASPRRICSG